MSSAFNLVAAVLSGALCAAPLLARGQAPAQPPASPTTLRVCADPNNLPFSNEQEQGFENELAHLVASDLGMNVAYTWAPQRSKFFQRTLLAGVCDVVLGVPSHIPIASTTQPYYRSTYVFVSRRDRGLQTICSFDDPRLRSMHIGIHSLGDTDGNLPPAMALAARGLASNLRPYSIFGNLSAPNPPADLIKAVADKSVDIAVAWGPLAGYFAQKSSVPLAVTPVCSAPQDARLAFSFEISMGVRYGDPELRAKLNSEIERRRPEIQHLLASYGVPMLPLNAAAAPVNSAHAANAPATPDGPGRPEASGTPAQSE
jgi:mxaJ protein